MNDAPQNRDYDRDDVDPADALGGAGALPMPDGQARGHVPTDRDEPGGEAAPEASEAGESSGGIEESRRGISP